MRGGPQVPPSQLPPFSTQALTSCSRCHCQPKSAATVLLSRSAEDVYLTFDERGGVVERPLAEQGARVLTEDLVRQLAAAGARVTALDRSARRMTRLEKNMARLGLSVETTVADLQDWQAQPFDAVLLDAPCTASGIVRRHPDVRWLRRPEDSAQLAHIQARLLKVLWPLLKPGGRLLYCTCSVFKAEGDAVVDSFLQRNTDARFCPSPRHLLPGAAHAGLPVGDNALGEHDGFYYALLEKMPTVA